jgi:histidyl-tRNA synthetase
VRQLLGPGRKDESGDFSKGAGLDNRAVGKLTKILTGMILDTINAVSPANNISAYGRNDDERTTNIVRSAFRPREGKDVIRELRDTLIEGDTTPSEAFFRGLDELSEIANLVGAAGYSFDRIRIDPSVVRGLEYYTGAVFEAELLFEIPNEKGQPVVFGSVGGGGRYDGLIGRFRGEDVPATGFSIGVSRLPRSASSTVPTKPVRWWCWSWTGNGPATTRRWFRRSEMPGFQRRCTSAIPA